MFISTAGNRCIGHAFYAGHYPISTVGPHKRPPQASIYYQALLSSALYFPSRLKKRLTSLHFIRIFLQVLIIVGACIVLAAFIFSPKRDLVTIISVVGLTAILMALTLLLKQATNNRLMGNPIDDTRLGVYFVY